MKEIREIEGSFDGTGRRFGLVASRFNERIVSRLVEGAIDCLCRHGVAPSDIVLARVSGAWEIPLALSSMVNAANYDGLIALGVVIRGETPHFDYVCGGASHGISEVSLRNGTPIGFGLLTCDDTSQAEERAGGKAGNKGIEAALATLEMVDLLAKVAVDSEGVS